MSHELPPADGFDKAIAKINKMIKDPAGPSWPFRLHLDGMGGEEFLERSVGLGNLVKKLQEKTIPALEKHRIEAVEKRREQLKQIIGFVEEGILPPKVAEKATAICQRLNSGEKVVEKVNSPLSYEAVLARLEKGQKHPLPKKQRQTLFLLCQGSKESPVSISDLANSLYSDCTVGLGIKKIRVGPLLTKLRGKLALVGLTIKNLSSGGERRHGKESFYFLDSLEVKEYEGLVSMAKLIYSINPDPESKPVIRMRVWRAVRRLKIVCSQIGFFTPEQVEQIKQAVSGKPIRKRLQPVQPAVQPEGGKAVPLPSATPTEAEKPKGRKIKELTDEEKVNLWNTVAHFIFSHYHAGTIKQIPLDPLEIFKIGLPQDVISYSLNERNLTEEEVKGWKKRFLEKSLLPQLRKFWELKPDVSCSLKEAEIIRVCQKIRDERKTSFQDVVESLCEHFGIPVPQTSSVES